MMKSRTTAILAAVVLGAAALIPVVTEARGGAGAGGGRGRCGQAVSQCRQQNPNCTQDRQRSRDGSCGNANCPQGTPGSNCPNLNANPQGATGAPPTAK